MRVKILTPAALGVLAAAALTGGTSASAAATHAAFTLSNASGGNRVLVFDRGSGGRLHRVGSVATGGRGTGANLGSQGALALSRDGSRLYAVNPGSIPFRCSGWPAFTYGGSRSCPPGARIRSA